MTYASFHGEVSYEYVDNCLYNSISCFFSMSLQTILIFVMLLSNWLWNL